MRAGKDQAVRQNLRVGTSRHWWQLGFKPQLLLQPCDLGLVTFF